MEIKDTVNGIFGAGYLILAVVLLLYALNIIKYDHQPNVIKVDILGSDGQPGSVTLGLCVKETKRVEAVDISELEPIE